MNKLKTGGRAFSVATIWRTALALAFALVFFPSQAVAQTGTVIQPCTEATPASKTPGPLAAKTITVRASGQTVVDDTVPADPAVEKILEPYTGRVRELETVIGKLENELAKGGIGGGSLGNFVTDGLRTQASRKLGHPVSVMITNSGGLRKNAIAPGDLRAADIFELLPFENALIQLDVTGEQLIKLLETVLTRRDAQSGARITYRLNAENNPEPVSVKLVDAVGRETVIDPKATYSIVTIDYLLGLRSGSYALLQEGKNVKPLGLTMRDAMMEHVKSETAAGRPIKAPIDRRFVLETATTPEGRPK